MHLAAISRFRVRPRILARAGVIAIAGFVGFVWFAPVSVAQQRSLNFLQEPACQTLTPTSQGGPAPKSPNLMVLRYLGAANHEIAYRDSIMLLDAYYTRTPPARPLGFTREDVKKATAILIGHGHGDHFADAPYVAAQTGASIIGGPPTAEAAKKYGVPDKQIVAVKGGELQEYHGFTVEAVLAHHSDRTPEFSKAAGDAWRAVQAATNTTRVPNPAEQVGSSDPSIADKGTIAYLFTFNNGGYRLLYLDSGGPTTDGERNVMQKIGGRTDMALVAYQGWFVPVRQIEATLPLVKLFKPDVFMPTHHDETGGGFPDLADYPLFMAVRDALPRTRSISPLYRTPVCVDVVTKEIYIGEPWAWAANKQQAGAK